MKSKRRIVLIDRPVQIGLVMRMTLHWLAFLATVIVVLPMFRAIMLGDFATPLAEQATRAGVDAAILTVVFVLLLPYFIFDVFRTTNRFAGPMYRLRQSIRSIVRGEPFRPFTFRKGDYWQDVAEDFNKMVARLQSGRKDAVESEAVEQDEAAAVG